MSLVEFKTTIVMIDMDQKVKEEEAYNYHIRLFSEDDKELADKLITDYHTMLLKAGRLNRKGNRKIGRMEAQDELFRELIIKECEKREIVTD